MKRYKYEIQYFDGKRETIFIRDEPAFSIGTNSIVDERGNWWFLSQVKRLVLKKRMTCIDHCSCKFANDNYRCGLFKDE